MIEIDLKEDIDPKMTIRQLIEMRDTLDKDIIALISKFETDSGAVVVDLGISRIEMELRSGRTIDKLSGVSTRIII